MTKLIFICAPYRGRNIEEVKSNIENAKRIAKFLLISKMMGSVFPVTPHLNTALFDFEAPTKSLPDAIYLEGIKELMARCDVVYCPFEDYQLTEGMIDELSLATERLMPIARDPVMLQGICERLDSEQTNTATESDKATAISIDDIEFAEKPSIGRVLNPTLIDFIRSGWTPQQLVDEGYAVLKTKEHVAYEAMIDIETLDTENSAVVFQVGLVIFDTTFKIAKSIQWNVKIDDQLTEGRTVSASTLAFHLDIPDNAKNALADTKALDLFDVTIELSEELNAAKPHRIWTKGSFDFNILADIYESVGEAVPWKFYQCRELRTLMSECGVPKGDVTHNALEDCLAQVKQLQACRERYTSDRTAKQ